MFRVVSSEEAAQIERLRYVLADGTKEGLVERPQDWPGGPGEQCVCLQPLGAFWVSLGKN